MQDAERLGPSCPVGENNCPILAKFLELEAEREHLLEQIATDGLTGLFNYKSMIKILDKEMERSRRSGLPTGLIIIDLDHFKRINDLYGHEAGNKALKTACSIWKKNIRRIDIACRYGGEEFAIILPSTRLHRAVKIAERLRKALGTTTFKFGKDNVSLTASFGVDTFEPIHQDNVESFITRVDKFLLEAKTRGRNQVFHREIIEQKQDTEISPEERLALLGKGI